MWNNNFKRHTETDRYINFYYLRAFSNILAFAAFQSIKCLYLVVWGLFKRAETVKIWKLRRLKLFNYSTAKSISVVDNRVFIFCIQKPEKFIDFENFMTTLSSKNINFLTSTLKKRETIAKQKQQQLIKKFCFKKFFVAEKMKN